MRTVRARHATARRWRRGAGRGPCMRVSWGEGSGGVGLGARGSCQGGGGRPPRAPALDSRHIWKAGRVAAGGCFGNGFIAGLAQFSYKSKNLFAERKQPPLMLAEPPLTIDADYATNDQAGAPDGVGTRAVLVAVSDCVFHGERVAGESAWALGARVRVVGAFDRLRANGFGERGCGGVAGVGETPPRRAPGYRLSPVRRWVCTGRQLYPLASAPTPGSTAI